ncbi:unnamed protein product [Cylicostephanus goldi]|uniref:Uncharacterized protein n=1 Tax=Cylicostephanus goldi TaxID=71465 RepID=A0A3P6UNS6_CYLGO|nr:unnamed protein product [Cylicostephanus goldi]
MAGVKYCKEREHGKEKRRAKEASENLPKEDTRSAPVDTVAENKEEHHVVEEEKRKIILDEVAGENVEEISQEETTGEDQAVIPIKTEVSENEAEKMLEPERSAKILSDDHLDLSSKVSLSENYHPLSVTQATGGVAMVLLAFCRWIKLEIPARSITQNEMAS